MSRRSRYASIRTAGFEGGGLKSSYYPPRARWHSPFFQATGALRRLVGLDRLHLPAELSNPNFLAALVVPGLGFYVRGEKHLGKALVLCGVMLAVASLILLGYPLGNLAFGLLLSLHVSGLLFLLNPWLAEVRLAFRLVLSLALLFLLSQIVYAPLRRQLQEHWAMPLRVRGTVVVVQKLSSPGSIKRGEWVAYSISGGPVAGVVVGNGFGLGPVLAVAGDQLRFTAAGLEVNGILQGPLAHLPAAGGVVVPEKHWFLWPEMNIIGHGHLGEPNVSAAMLHLAMVPETQFVGKPYRWWFWRRQHFL